MFLTRHDSTITHATAILQAEDDLADSSRKWLIFAPVL